jgi:3-hydroxyacyl-CoA dehydrogenase
MDPDTDIFRTVETRCRARTDATLLLTLEGARPRISVDVLLGIERAVENAERTSMPLVIASASKHFAFGADLDDALAEAASGRTELLNDALRNYQRVMLRVRYASVPVVAAVTGVAVSGGCELLMHCARVVAHTDSSIGLFEAAAGVVPSGGGLKEFARRAAESDDPPGQLRTALATICAPTVAKAADASRFGFLTARDMIVDAAPIDVAARTARELHSKFTPPTQNSAIRVAGRELFAQLREAQRARFDRQEITAHQLEINTRIAEILCGGDVPAGTRTESDLLALERVHFLVLARSPLSQARVAHLRATGKPLVN